MNSASSSFLDIEGIDSWLASNESSQQQRDAALSAWLQEVLQSNDHDTAGPSTQAGISLTDGSISNPLTLATSPSATLEQIRRKNRLAQQRSRKRRNDHVKELEEEVRHLKELLAAERRRSLPIPYQRRIGQDTDADIGLDKQLQGSASMSHLLASLADGTFDDRFFPLLGRHFGNSEPHRQSRQSSLSSFQDPDAAISWLISFTTDSNNFARAASARQMSLPSAIVMPELVLYKVCRFYFRLLLPFSTSFGSGLVNLNSAKVVREPEMVFTRAGHDTTSRTDASLSQDGTLPEVLMPTRTQRMVGTHPIEIAVIPFATLREKLLLTLMAMNGGQSFKVDDSDVTVIPDNNKIYEFDFSHKPNSGRAHPDASSNNRTSSKEGPSRRDPLRPVARKWLDTFMVDFVGSLRVWSASDDCFNTTGFELRPDFVAKYGLMLDADIIKTSNFWRRSRGEPRLPIG
ncbi:uncharacterized protein UTRI_10087 [Ustilago trichophora]|uniref:BZIP domain-containing protein n=1 Tax=Ustilago trichophora TaxID=86804 RepID=A0A5C3E6S3_9BASI|nr:uncharacterized protein UTRI_10087 [Ustilago trichophora]